MSGSRDGLEGIDLGQDGERALPVASRGLDSHSQTVVQHALYYRAQATVWLRRAEAWVQERARLAREVDELGKRAMLAMDGAGTGSAAAADGNESVGESMVVLSSAIDERKRSMVALTLRIQDAQAHRQHFHTLCDEEGLSGDGWIRRVLAENKLPRRLSRTVGSRLLKWFATMLVTLNLRLHAALGAVDGAAAGIEESSSAVGSAGEPTGARSAASLRSRIQELESSLERERAQQQKAHWQLQKVHAMAQHDDAEKIAGLRLELSKAEVGTSRVETNADDQADEIDSSDE